jgi:hypothetical protein
VAVMTVVMAIMIMAVMVVIMIIIMMEITIMTSDVAGPLCRKQSPILPPH